MKVTYAVRAARLRRVLDQRLIPSRRLERKVAKAVKGEDVTFTIAELSDLRVASRLAGRKLFTSAKFVSTALQAAVILWVA